VEDERLEVEPRVNKALFDADMRHSVVLSESETVIELPEGSESESAARIRELDARLNPDVTSETGESATAEHIRKLEAVLNDESAALAEAAIIDARIEDQAARLGELDAKLAPVEGDAAAMIEPSQATVDDAWSTDLPA